MQEKHRKVWLCTDLLSMKIQGDSEVGKHYGCYHNEVASKEKSCIGGDAR